MPASRYEWDAHKSAKNVQKHSVAFEEAATVFDDPMFVTLIDAEHSTDEERYITIGLSKQGRLLVIAHTDRHERIRLISARKATRKEIKFYAEAD